MAVERGWFEDNNARIHTRYGRLICWIIFSAGAEILAKGVCMTRCIDVLIDDNRPKLTYPTELIEVWLNDVKAGVAATEHVSNFGTIGQLTDKHLKTLCKIANATPEQTNIVVGALIGDN